MLRIGGKAFRSKPSGAAVKVLQLTPPCGKVDKKEVLEKAHVRVHEIGCGDLE